MKSTGTKSELIVSLAIGTAIGAVIVAASSFALIEWMPDFFDLMADQPELDTESSRDLRPRG